MLPVELHRELSSPFRSSTMTLESARRLARTDPAPFLPVGRTSSISCEPVPMG